MDAELFHLLRREYPKSLIASVDVDGSVVTVKSGRVVSLIGRDGVTADGIVEMLRALPRFTGVDVDVQFVELRRLELEPVLVADHVLGRIARGAPDATSLSAKMAMQAGALGCRIVVTGAHAGEANEGVVDATAPPDATVDGEGATCAVWLARRA